MAYKKKDVYKVKPMTEGKKNIIHTPEPEKPIWEIIIDLISGKGKNKSLLDWVKDNSFN